MAGYFPITDHGVHTLREESKTTETPFRLSHHPHTFDFRDVAKPEGFQRGKVKSPNGIGQMGQSMGTGVTVFHRIRHSSDAESVDYQHYHTSNHGRTIA
jgi:hypothetical protein